MLESFLAGFAILLLYKLAHDFMLTSMLEGAKKPLKPADPEKELPQVH